jgi:hypothetical protein
LKTTKLALILTTKIGQIFMRIGIIPVLLQNAFSAAR